MSRVGGAGGGLTAVAGARAGGGDGEPRAAHGRDDPGAPPRHDARPDLLPRRRRLPGQPRLAAAAARLGRPPGLAAAEPRRGWHAQPPALPASRLRLSLPQEANTR